MQHIDIALRNRPAVASRETERGSLIQFFTEHVNADRDGKRYKKLPIAAIAVKLSHLSVPDLYFLKSVCSDAERHGTAFGRVFFGSIKSK
jgi:hypothetical protein